MTVRLEAAEPQLPSATWCARRSTTGTCSGLRARGADILNEPEDRISGQREIVVRGRNGLVLAFGESMRATDDSH